ncbi:hypothetical protein [Burkholderia sp. Bp8992]|uniref:hypothetical protein n=1 Tax=Burkholderia sp. Bp8992 TaxID=2184554 RepID=UPI0026AF9FC5
MKLSAIELVDNGVGHRLENPGQLSPEIIEVQTGSHLGERDIACFDGAYGRV